MHRGTFLQYLASLSAIWVALLPSIPDPMETLARILMGPSEPPVSTQTPSSPTRETQFLVSARSPGPKMRVVLFYSQLENPRQKAAETEQPCFPRDTLSAHNLKSLFLNLAATLLNHLLLKPAMWKLMFQRCVLWRWL